MRHALKALAVICAWAMSAGLASSETLVTKEEAALPPAKGAVGVAMRGITRGPKVEFVTAPGEQRSPTMFNVRFESFGGATIDLSSVKVTYVRSPNVDLTPRVRPFLQPTGIMMPNAELPPGDHLFRIDLLDSGGRSGTANFNLKITP